MKRAAIYARKSNDTEDGRTESVDRQLEGGRAWIAKRGWLLDETNIYRDDGISGALFLGRPEFQRMLRDAAAGAFSEVVLFDLDRFGRNSRLMMEALHALADLGVSVWDYSTSQRVDLDSFEGRMMTTFKAEFAQQYLESVRKKVRFAMHAKAEKGDPTGPAPFGYENVVRDGRKGFAIVEREAGIVVEIFQRFAAGASPYAIVRWLNSSGIPSASGRGWSTQFIRVVLRRSIYRGWLEYGRTEVRYGRETGKGGRERAQIKRQDGPLTRALAPDLRIIPEDLQAAVDGRLTEGAKLLAEGRARGASPHKSAPRYLLSSLIVCPSCGAGFVGHQGGWQRQRPMYVCSSRRYKVGTCECRLAFPVAETDAEILRALESEILGTRLVEDLLRLVETAPDPGIALRAERERLQAEVGQLVEALAKRFLSMEDAAGKIAERKAEIAKLDEKLAGLRQHPTVDKDRVRAALERRTAQWVEILRSEPAVARALVRRVLGPITFFWDDEEDWPTFLLLDDEKPKALAFAGGVGPSTGLIPWTAEFRASAFGDGLLPEVLLGTSERRRTSVQ